MQPLITLEVSAQYPLPQHIAAGIGAFVKEFGRAPVRIWIPYDVYQRAMWEFGGRYTVANVLGGGIVADTRAAFPDPPAGAEPPAIDSINGLSVTVYVPTAKYDKEILIL
jgi:hypothetical protein